MFLGCNVDKSFINLDIEQQEVVRSIANHIPFDIRVITNTYIKNDFSEAKTRKELFEIYVSDLEMINIHDKVYVKLGRGYGKSTIKEQLNNILEEKQIVFLPANDKLTSENKKLNGCK